MKGNSSPIHIFLVTYHMQWGGAERVLSILANYWANLPNHRVTLVTYDQKEPFYTLDEKVRRITIPLGQESASTLQGFILTAKRVQALRKLLKKHRPSAVVSFMHLNNIRTLLAAKGLGIPVLISERSNPFVDTIPGFWNRLRTLTYPWASTIILQTEASREFFPAALHPRCTVIPNPIDAPKVRREGPRGDGEKVLISMGRLVDAKGFDWLLTSFAKISDKVPGWKLRILGEGDLRAPLEQQRKELGLEDRVELPGQITDTQAELAKADLYVLSSRYEGFPNALAEAMAVGLPAVAFDCKYGPRDVIRPDVDGVLVPAENLDELSAALLDLMTDDAKRERLAQSAAELTERFGTEKVMNRFTEEVHKAISTKR